MKHIRWGIIVASLIVGAFWGILVGILSHSKTDGIIAFFVSTVVYIFILCLNSSNSSN